MAVSHVFSNAQADWTGTVTVGNSAGATTTAAATNLVRPVDWNSVHNQFYTLSGNTNNASTASGTNVVLQGVGGVTLIGSTDTIGISAAAAAAITHSMFHPYENEMVTGQQGNNAMHVMPVVMPNVQHDRIGVRVLFSNNTNSTGSVTINQWVGLYTRNVSTLSLLASTSTSRGHTFSGTDGNFSLQHGIRNLTIPWTQTITQGDYWWGLISSTSTAGANMTFSALLVSQPNSSFSGGLGEASNSTNQRLLGMGQRTGLSAGVNNSLAFSQIVGGASIYQRQPMFFLLSGSV